jgi:hypothetical protein
MNIKVYDKVKWHYPDGKNCPCLDAAVLHIKTILEWLYAKNLLTDYGLEIYDLGVSTETSLTSDMLQPMACTLLDEVYNKWLESIEYGKKPSLGVFDALFEKSTVA